MWRRSRGLVDPGFLPTIFIPYGGLLANGRVVHDRAEEVDGSRVVLGSGEVLTPDFVVLASGSTYPFPAKAAADRADDSQEHVARHAQGTGRRRPHACWSAEGLWAWSLRVRYAPRGRTRT